MFYSSYLMSATNLDTKSMEEKLQTILQAQEELIEDFEYFEDWADRYRFIIDLGRKLKTFPKEWMIDEYKVRGCQSQVWLKPDKRDDKLIFYARPHVGNSQVYYIFGGPRRT